jgi:hypothetical protein
VSLIRSLRTPARILVALKQTQEKWDKLEDENRQLNVLVATLRQQLNECRVQLGFEPDSTETRKNKEMLALLKTPCQQLKLTVRAEKY